MKKQHKQWIFTALFIGIFAVIACCCQEKPQSIGGFIEPLDTAQVFRNGGLNIVNEENKAFWMKDAALEKKRVNILLLGVEGKARTDTIMFISYDVQKNKLNVISIPRDTYYHEQGYNRGDQRKLNAVYGRTGEPGCVKAVSKILGDIPIDYYISVDYEAVEEIVDSISGIEVEVPMDMAVGGIKIHKGLQVLHGKEALQYLRFRKKYKDGDLGRIKAQQKLISAALKKLKYIDIPVLAAKHFSSVRTNMPLGQMIYYARRFTDDKTEESALHIIPGVPMYKAVGGYNWSYFFHNPQKTNELLDSINRIKSSDQRRRERYEQY